MQRNMDKEISWKYQRNTGVERTDNYGFIINETDETKMSRALFKRENSRTEKWKKMLKNIEYLILKRDPTLKSRIRKGIPSGLRHIVWPILCDFKGLKKEMKFSYDHFIEASEYPCEEQIEVDVRRTFGNNIFFSRGIGKKAATNILKAISLAFPDVGYLQGMNSLSAFFSCNLSDEDSFWMFVYLYERRSLKKFFREIVNMNRNYYIFDKLAAAKIPKIKNALDKIELGSNIYITEYFITLFSGVLNFDICVRIFDIFIYENEKILFRAALAILKLLEKIILSDFEYGMKFKAVKMPKLYLKITPDNFIERCLKFKFSQGLIDKYHDDYLKTKD